MSRTHVAQWPLLLSFSSRKHYWNYFKKWIWSLNGLWAVIINMIIIWLWGTTFPDNQTRHMNWSGQQKTIHMKDSLVMDFQYIHLSENSFFFFHQVIIITITNKNVTHTKNIFPNSTFNLSNMYLSWRAFPFYLVLLWFNIHTLTLI